jgi:hypothetical protein
VSTVDSIKAYVPFVKDQVAHQEAQASRAVARGDEKRAQAYQSRAAVFRQMLVDFEALGNAAPANISAENSLRLTPEEIRDLPEELLAELSISEADRKDFQVIEIIDALGGMASIDKILVSIYRKTGEIEKRSRLNARLYRMANKGSVFAHPDKKGVYSTHPTPGSAAVTSGQQLMGFDEAVDSDLA